MSSNSKPAAVQNAWCLFRPKVVRNNDLQCWHSACGILRDLTSSAVTGAVSSASIPTKDGKPGKLTVIGTYHGTFSHKTHRLYYLHPTTNQWLIVILLARIGRLVRRDVCVH